MIVVDNHLQREGSQETNGNDVRAAHNESHFEAASRHFLRCARQQTGGAVSLAPCGGSRAKHLLYHMFVAAQ